MYRSMASALHFFTTRVLELGRMVVAGRGSGRSQSCFGQGSIRFQPRLSAVEMVRTKIFFVRTSGHWLVAVQAGMGLHRYHICET